MKPLLNAGSALPCAVWRRGCLTGLGAIGCTTCRRGNIAFTSCCAHQKEAPEMAGRVSQTREEVQHRLYCTAHFLIIDCFMFCAIETLN